MEGDDTVSPHIEFKRFTELSADTIGGRLSDIVGDRANWRILRRDFLHLNAYYGGRRRAVSFVKDRRYHMSLDPRYVAMVVVADGQIIGVTSLTQSNIPFQPNCSGPNLALWLDPSRPPHLRYLQGEIMLRRLEYLLADNTFTGHMWSVIRPDNKQSLEGWTNISYNGIEFMRVDHSPHNYSAVDGIKTPRLLCTSVFALEQLRSMC